MCIYMPISHYTAQGGFNEFKISNNSRLQLDFPTAITFLSLKSKVLIAQNKIMRKGIRYSTSNAKLPNLYMKEQDAILCITKDKAAYRGRHQNLIIALHCIVMLRNQRVFLKTSSNK